MKVVYHRLCRDDGTPFTLVPSPNRRGAIVAYDLLVIHCTEGQSVKAAVATLTKPKGASAHLVIGRDGEIVQLVPFDTAAKHTGQSSWKELTGLDYHSIGFELDNPGKLKPALGKWLAWFRKPYPPDSMIKAIHKFDTKRYGWHKYTQIQLQTTAEAAAALVAHYSIKEIVGHEDISPRLKWDPGPAFPMESFRANVLDLVRQRSSPQPPT
jgi:N-acetylmuramoyl-L-alanine amidase